MQGVVIGSDRIARTAPESLAGGHSRPVAAGKFLFIDGKKFFVKGVTYGAFRPDANELEFQDEEKIDRDFAMMAEHGANVVRIPHTMPPRHLLDIALRRNLRVMVGLSAEQYTGFLIDTAKAPDIEGIIRTKVRAVAGHPALLCYGLGNEIAPGLARWLGRDRIEAYLRGLYDAVKAEDPGGLVTYVNYPTTEYLHLPFLDLVCFNVYLEDNQSFRAYLSRLHNIAGDRPLIMSEVGLDSMRNGLEKQAHVLDWQIRSTFQAGCAGAIVFSWTDEWYRGGGDVTDWAFGLTDCERRPKPALAAARRAFAAAPMQLPTNAPRISVVVCSFNGSRTIGQCLENLEKLNYPDYEVIVVDDGSTDHTAEIVGQFRCNLIRTKNEGLSSARNTGMQAATGEIIAYIDDDAYPDPDWLTFLSAEFAHSDHAAIGGPNLPPPEDGMVAQCVARAPGGPTHVLLTDTIAEHVPGCNLAIRKERLLAIGGFDSHFRVAGDDVDVCWKLQERGWTIGFCPPAVVWHHRRASVGAYLRQQRFYGKAEALLEQKWPERFNQVNHMSWAGRVYTAGLLLPPGTRSVVYHGVWGESPFQSLYGNSSSIWAQLPMLPEWHLINAALLGVSLLGFAWWPLFAVAPVFLISFCWPLRTAISRLRHVKLGNAAPANASLVRIRLLLLWLTLLQPFARLYGRLAQGLSPWRKRGIGWLVLPRRQNTAQWCETWLEPHERLANIERALHAMGLIVWRGGPYDNWDLEVHAGVFGSARILLSVEDQGSGTQYVRVGIWPRFSRVNLALIGIGAALATLAGRDGSIIAATVLALGSLLLGLRNFQEAGYALNGAAEATRLDKAE